MIFDAEIRDYVIYFFLQDLRQVHYNKGGRQVTPLENLCSRIRDLLIKRRWTIELLDKHGIKLEMMESIAIELIKDKYIEIHSKKIKKGFVFKKTIEHYYYKITTIGLEYSKKMSHPQDPLKNMR